jgi:hypothetical protein
VHPPEAISLTTADSASPRPPPPRQTPTPTTTMSAEAEPSAYGAETFAEGNWYHELLEDGLALSYRVRLIDGRTRRVVFRSWCRVCARARSTTDG